MHFFKKPTKRSASKSGFTLIEILVVMAILGILTVAALASYNTAQMRGRDSKRKSNLRQVASALELYYNDYGHYPWASAGVIKGCTDQTSSSTATTCAWGSSFKDDKGTIYMANLPKDPRDPNAYYYYETNGSSGNAYYFLYARFENLCDVDTPKDSSNHAEKYSKLCTLGSDNCNYVITSPDQSAPAHSGYSTAVSCN